MEALAGRVGRVEARLDSLRNDVFSLQGTVKPQPSTLAAVPASETRDGSHAATQEWVRLFELELEASRRQISTCDDQILDLQDRLAGLERHSGLSANGSTANIDAEELAEIVLTELREIQQRLHVLGSGEPLPTGLYPLDDLPDDHPAARAASRRVGLIGERLDALDKGLARVESFAFGPSQASSPNGNLTQAGNRAASRLDRGEISRTLRLDYKDEPVAGGLQDRMERMEKELAGLESLRRHGASLQALVETEEKIEGLQKQLAGLPFDEAMSRAAVSIQGMETAAHKDSGNLSVFDSYRVKAGLDQVMVAMEALTRQRNDDIRLLNSYLDEVYKRLDSDLPKSRTGGIGDAQKLRSEIDELKLKIDSFESVQFRELEARILREVQFGSEEVSACREQSQDLEANVLRALEQSAQSEVRIKSLAQAFERNAANALREEAVQSEFRRELAQLRVDMAQGGNTSAGIGQQGADGFLGVQLETRISVMQAELEALVEKKAIDAVQRHDILEREMNALRRESLRLDEQAQERVGQDVERVARDLRGMQKELLSLDTQWRERFAKSERETRAEVKVMHQLMLEVSQKAQTGAALSNLLANASAGNAAGKGRTISSPQLHDKTSPLALPGTGAGFGGGLTPRGPGGSAGLTPRGAGASPEVDVGVVTPVSSDTVEWRVQNVRALARGGDGRALVSKSFAVPNFSSTSGLRLKLFPQGSKKRMRPGFCSLYLTGPEGLHLQFLLRIGSAEQGPLECLFDRPNKETGRHDFCSIEDELEDDGSALIRLIVLRADP